MPSQLLSPPADAAAIARSAVPGSEPANPAPRGPRTWRQRLPWLVAGALLALVYAPIAWSALVDCWNDSNYSHGVLIPLVVVLLMRARRCDPVDLDARTARRNTVWAWLWVAAGLAAHIAGSAAAESFTLRMSGVCLAVGLCGVVAGPAAMRRFGPALALLACAVPLPYVFYYRISVPMQLVSAQLASATLHGMGFDVTRSGNVFQVGGHALEVIGACSGIRSMMALSTLALVGGVWMRLGAARVAAIAALALPVAMLGNILRLVITALLVLRFGPKAAEGTIHEAAGVVCFALSVALLAGVLHGVRRIGRRSRTGAAPAATAAAAEVSVNAAPASHTSPRAGAVARARPVWAAAVALALVAGYGGWLRAHARVAAVPVQLDAMPLALAEYSGADVEIDARTREQLRADAFLFRSYAHPVTPSVGLYLGYYRDPRQGAQIHSPLHCYPGGGWKVLRSEPLRVRDLAGEPTRMQRLVVRKQDRHDVVVYWYDTRIGRLTGDVALKLALMRTALLHQPQDVAFVRWSTPQAEGEDLDATTRRLLRAVALATPSLEAGLPFAP